MIHKASVRMANLSRAFLAYHYFFAIACGVGLLIAPAFAQSTLKETIKTIGRSAVPEVRVSIPFAAASRIVIVNGDTNGKLLPVVAGANLSVTTSVDVVTTEGPKQKTRKEKRLVPVVIGSGEQVTLVVSNQTQATETVSIIVKYYDEQGKFVAASRPKDFLIPPAPGTTSQTWVFRNADLRTD